MKQSAIRFLASAAIVLCISAKQPLSAEENTLDNVSVTQAQDGMSIVAIESGRKLGYEQSEISEPPQIILTIKDDVPCPKLDLSGAKNSMVNAVKISCSGESGKARLKSIIVSLNKKASVLAAQRDWILTLTLQEFSGLSSEPKTKVPEKPLPPVPAPVPTYQTSEIRMNRYADAQDFDPNHRILSSRPDLEEFVSVGLANYRPLEIAKMELKLSNQKLFESWRNFFPTVAARGSQSQGSTLISPTDLSTKADFERKELGIELGQPIFQSGRVFYSQKQARAQRDAAELSLTKATQEAVFEVLRNLYTFLQTREALSIRKSLLEESAKIVDTTKKKRDIGISSDSEYLGVLSAGNQIEYKALSEEKDFEIARSRLMGALNVESIPVDVPINLEDLSAKKVPATNLDLDNLLALALSNRPEIKAAYLGKKIKEYARKTARGEYLMKVDASGFVGQSGAAFRGEPLTMKDSYNVGLRGTLYFGGSSVSPQYSNEKSAPDLGSNSRTETRAQSVSVGVLDSLGARSNYFQSQIEEEKAKEEFSSQRKQIVIEVKEAFYNYQRARIQIDTAKKELEYRKKEGAIAQTKDRLHQIEATQYLQSVSAVTESEVGIREAMAYYLTSLAALEKATGQPLTR